MYCTYQYLVSIQYQVKFENCSPYPVHVHVNCYLPSRAAKDKLRTKPQLRIHAELTHCGRSLHIVSIRPTSLCCLLLTFLRTLVQALVCAYMNSNFQFTMVTQTWFKICST